MPLMQGDERTASQGFFEMLWDCDHCGTKRLLGKSQRHCPECGAKQNPDKRYFPPEGSETRVEGHTYEGADSLCPACDAPMGAKVKSCMNCGAPMDGSQQVRGVMAAPAVAAAPKPRNWKKLGLIAAAVLVVIFGIWFVVFRTKDAVVKVTAHEWSRAIAIEEFSDQLQESWRDTMPADARSPMCRMKQKSTRQVADGETCRDDKIDKKDGTFEVVTKCTPKTRSEPIEAEWCTYTITRWHEVDVRKVGGTGLSLAWPTMDLPPPTAAAVPGARRQGRKTETRSLRFGNTRCDDVSDAIWRKYTDGQAAKVEVRARTGDVVCSSL